MRRKILAAAAVSAALVATAFVAPQAAASGVCTDPDLVLNGWQGQGLDEYYADGDVWNEQSIDQTMSVCDRSSWFVDVTADDNDHDGAVQSYPNVHRDYHDWGTGEEPLLSSFSSIPSTFAHTAPDGSGVWDVAYDLWLNGFGGSANEVMVWTENKGQTPAGDKVAEVTLNGVDFDVWTTSGHGYVSYVAKQTVTSGSWDLKEFIDDMDSRGWLPANSTLAQVDYGVEIVSTDSEPRHFDFTDFSVDAVPASDPTPTPTSTQTSEPPVQHGQVVDHGRVKIKPVPNKATSLHVDFPAGEFSEKPSVAVTARTSVPFTRVKAVSTLHVTKDGFDILLYRTNNVATGIDWVAVGE